MRDKYLIMEERKVNDKLKEERKDENKGGFKRTRNTTREREKI